TPAGPLLSDKIAATYEGVLYGPSLSRLSDGEQAPTDAGGTHGMKVDSVLSAAYKFSPDVLTRVGMEWYMTKYKGAEMRDPYIQFRNSKLITAGDYTMDGRIYLYPGISNSSLTANQLAKMRYRMNHNLELGKGYSLSGNTTLYQKIYSDRSV